MGSTAEGAAPHTSVRRNLCLGQPEPHFVLHDTDSAFANEVGKLYKSEESRLIEGVIELKSMLKHIGRDEFWSYLSERLALLLGAQMSFVSKRMLVDEQDRAVEMPPIGEPGACLMASALYYNDGRGTKDTLKTFKYHAWGCPCAQMRHDKVFIVPEQMGIFSPREANPNELPIDLESYMGVPLFAEDGKCFAHFGVIWSPEGIRNRTLSWAVMELAMHSLEDVILDHLLDGSEFRNPTTMPADRTRIIPHAAITAAQSLKPYARSLSHELRTPMQGVVGMLDVMYATVLEAAESQKTPEVRKIFEQLRENIEIVQDSSRRAVEAADNVVHAYDMDMHVPNVAHSMISGNETTTPVATHDRPGILVAGSNLPIQRPNKRRRDDDPAAPNKIPATIAEWTKRAEPSEELVQGVHEAADMRSESAASVVESVRAEDGRAPDSPTKLHDRTVAPGLRHTQIRNVLQYVVNEGLKNGGRPESAVARETEFGEIIEVQTSKSTGELRSKVIEWSVHPAVPTTMFVDEKDLGKLISCVVLNAIKFTEQGRITVQARMSARHRHVVVSVADSGPGIPKAFLPRLFTAFSQEDASLTRQSEGLGLGLLVAKGIARKLGGDLTCSRTETEGDSRGSEFEIRVPVSPADQFIRSTSPSDTSNDKSDRAGTAPLEDGETPSALPTPTEIDEPIKFRPPSKQRRPLLSDLRTPSVSIIPEVIDGFRIPPIPSPGGKSTPEASKRPAMIPRKSSASMSAVDRDLAKRYPLTFLVAEDNKINRKLLVSMLNKFGYKTVHEAYDGAEAVRQMEKHKTVDVVLMDLWMPFMDGYEATEKILSMEWSADGITDAATRSRGQPPTVLAVTADVTDAALDRAAKVGMKGFMTKPFKLLDLQRLIVEYCASRPDDAPDGVESAAPAIAA